MEFLWVQWYKPLGTIATGWAMLKLDHLGFFPMADDDVFRFIDPSDIV
jgi:hypothetical protein